MNMELSNNIASLAPNADFAIYGNVSTEAEYNSNVVFVVPGQKPSWSAVQGNIDSQKWKEVRNFRNQLLVASDWTRLDDNQLSESKKTEWETYRQSLRDITTQSDPHNLTWPNKPE